MKATVQKLVVALVSVVSPAMALQSVAASTEAGDRIVSGNLVYQPGEQEWTIVGHTLTPGCSETSRQLFVTGGILDENGETISSNKNSTKVFAPEVFANDSLIRIIKGPNGWCGTKAFYNASGIERYEVGFDYTVNGHFAVGDSVFMNSGLKYFYCEGQDAFGKSYFEGTKQLTFVYIPYLGIPGENMFKNSAVETIDTYMYYQSQIPAGMFEGSNLNRINFETRPAITTIGTRAFKNCKMTSANDYLTGRVKTISEEAFEGTPLSIFEWSDCLKTIGARAFKSTALKEAYLSPVIETIGEGAFADCAELTDVFISNPEPPAIVWDDADAKRCSLAPDVTIWVPGYAIENYRSFTDSQGNNPWSHYRLEAIPAIRQGRDWEWRHVVYSPEGIVKGHNITSDMLSRTITLPIGALNEVDFTNTQTPFYFDGQGSPFAITFPEGIFEEDAIVDGLYDVGRGHRVIGRRAFAATNVENVRLMEVEIGEEAFKDSKVRSLSLVWATLGDRCFENTTLLKSVVIDRSVCFTGSEAFRNSALEEFIYSPQPEFTELPEATFEGANLKAFKISKSDQTEDEYLTTIGDRAFANTRLETLEGTYPSLTSIGSKAFAGTLLSSLPEANSLSFIGEEAFAHTRIESIKFPISLDEVGAGAFAGCEGLSSIWVYTMIPPAIVWDDEHEERCSFPVGTTVYVPEAYLKYYLADPAWKNYVIVGQSE